MHIVIIVLAICAFASASSQSNAGTIVKLSLGGDPAADVEFTGGAGGVLSTTDDLVPSAGEQNTSVEFSDVLDPVAADIVTSIASVTLDGVTATGPTAVLFGNLVLQGFTGGSLSLYDSADNLLLSGTLTTSTLSGTLGPPATGGLFTTAFGQFTGGSLASYLDSNSLELSMGLAGINGGAGLSVTPPPPFPAPIVYPDGVLNAFTAEASIAIAAAPIPEPTTIALLLLSGALTAMSAQRRRRRSMVLII